MHHIVLSQNSYEADTSFINKLNALSLKLIRQSPDSSKQSALDAIRLSEKMQYDKGLGDGYTRLGILEKNKGNQDSALAYYRISHYYRKKTAIQKDIGKSCNNLGNIFALTGKYDSAIYYHLQCIRIAEKENDTVNLVDYYNNLGIDYTKNKDFQNALKYCKLSFNCASISSKAFQKLRAQSNIGSAFINLGIYDSAIIYLKHAVENPDAINDDLAGDAFNNLGLAYDKKNLPDSALYFYEQAMGYYERSENPDLSACLSNIGVLLLSKNKNAEAISYFMKSNIIASKADQVYLLETNYQFLADAYKNLKQYDSAYQALQLKVYWSDLIFNREKENAVAEMQTKYETEKKEKQILLSEKEISKQKHQKNFIIVSAILLIGSVLFFLINHQLRKKLQYEKKLQTEKTRISSDLHDEIGSSLTGISIFSELAQKQMQKQNYSDAEGVITTIGDTSRELIENMSDFIWAVNPENDDFENMLNRLHSFASRILDVKQIEFQYDIKGAIENYNLSMENRHHIYMILKEAIHNAAKYSGAKRVFLKVSESDKNLHFEVGDDGIGFQADTQYEGNGLKNMRNRASEIQAGLHIHSEEGKGTIIELNLREVNHHK